jgi:hypothetical protein
MGEHKSLAEGVVQVVEHLPSRYEALDSIPITVKTKQNKNSKKNRGKS